MKSGLFGYTYDAEVTYDMSQYQEEPKSYTLRRLGVVRRNSKPLMFLKSRRWRRRSLNAIVLLSAVLSFWFIYQEVTKPTYWEPPSPFNSTDCSATPDLIRHNHTTRFRDSLLSTNKYITSFTDSRWGSDVVALLNLIYLAHLTRRIPILPPFHSTTHDNSPSLIPFNAIFDIAALSKSINHPVLEWKDIKNFTNTDPQSPRADSNLYGGDLENLGCWSTWMTQSTRGNAPREGQVAKAVGVDISWTPVPFNDKNPRRMKKLGHDGHDYDLYRLASLSYRSGREDGIRLARDDFRQNLRDLAYRERKLHKIYQAVKMPWYIPIPNSANLQVDPDDHLLCFDFLSSVATHEGFEWWHEDSTVWNAVGTHLHFQPRITTLSQSYIRHAIAISDSADIPNFIAVHIRRGGFKSRCGRTPLDVCLPPLSAYSKLVAEVEIELRARFPGTAKFPVVVISDEPRSTMVGGNETHSAISGERWWKEVESLGWFSIHHGSEKTSQVLGTWYEAILDLSILSMASGFVGTDHSKSSLISSKRVQDWSGGSSRLVTWGGVGVDDTLDNRYGRHPSDT